MITNSHPAHFAWTAVLFILLEEVDSNCKAEGTISCIWHVDKLVEVGHGELHSINAKNKVRQFEWAQRL